MSNKCFKSKGIIRVKLSNGSPSLIFFTPNDDSTVRYGDKRYAVFLQESSEDCLVRKFGDAGEGVPIKVNAVNAALSGLVVAAVQQTLIEVEVQEVKAQKAGTSCMDLTLCAITIPAPGKQK